MDRPGEKLKRVRERLGLTYRDVEEASQRLADRLSNVEFGIALSRLADIENKGTPPSIYRLYSLCAIYRMEIAEVLSWYGAPVDRMPAEALRVPLDKTHPVQFLPAGWAALPTLADGDLDLNKTTFLSRLIESWGSVPLRFLNGHDMRRHRYALIGMEDWSMYPVLHPGSLVVIDDRARIAAGGWTSEYDRPIYFFERRDGYCCGWCDLTGDQLVILHHPASHQKPSVYQYPAEIDLVGQVTGVAMLLAPARRRRARISAVPAASPDL
ncbi:MAG: helix-turn-helix domain-containing protein [Acidobacteriia bacterium]|nr:helix-turn-helix domain-containing protein [Terriglobia bacterium]